MTDEEILDAAGYIVALRARETGAEYVMVFEPSGLIRVEATIIRHAGTRARSHTLRAYEASGTKHGAPLGGAWKSKETT